MFRFLRKNKTKGLGYEIMEEMSALLSDEKNQALYNNLILGFSTVPFDMANVAARLMELSYALTSMTGLNSMNIAECAKKNKWTIVEKRLEGFNNVLQVYIKKRSGDFVSLFKWADKNKIPELTDYGARAYPVKGLPRDIGKAAMLRTLYLGGNGIHELPAEIDVFPMLSALCISNNEVKGLPNSLFNIVALQRIDAANNLITTIPQEIGRLKYLHTLDLDENLINVVDRGILECPSLDKLLLRKQKHGTTVFQMDNAAPVLSKLYSRHVDVKS